MIHDGCVAPGQSRSGRPPHSDRNDFQPECSQNSDPRDQQHVGGWLGSTVQGHSLGPGSHHSILGLDCPGIEATRAAVYNPDRPGSGALEH
jgi:hypothetical protein